MVPLKNAIVYKDRPSSTKIKNLHETGQIVSYRPENHRFRLWMCVRLKRGTIKSRIVDKDRLSLDKVEHLHETGQIVSYRLQDHRFRLILLRAESWYR